MSGYGKIHFKVKYDQTNQKLDVVIIECKDLRNADLLGKSDPYLRIFMLPGRHMELKTKTKANTLNPIYNETFSFTIPLSTAQSKTVVFQVFDSDLGKDKPLGEAQMAFQAMDLHMDNDFWVDLHEISGQPPVVKTKSYVRTTSVSSVSSKTSVASTASYQQSSHVESTSRAKYNLRELNSRLEHVIAANKKNYDLDLDLAEIIVTLVRNTVDEDEDYSLDLQEQSLELAFDEYGSVEAEIEWLKKENQILAIRIDEVDEKIKERVEKESLLWESKREWEGKVAHFNREKETLEASKITYQHQLEEARRGLEYPLEALRKQRREEWKWREYDRLVDLLSSRRTQRVDSIMREMTAETECPSVYWNLVYNKVREEYNKRMDEEMRKMREVYMKFESEIKGFEMQEMARLSRTLEHDRTSQAGGEMNIVISEMESVKKAILELEMERLSLKQKIFELNFTLEDQELFFNAQYKAKSDALAFLTQEYENMKDRFLFTMSRVDGAEVRKYSRAIEDGYSHSARKSSRFESASGQVVLGVSLTPGKEGDSWTVEEHYEILA